MGVVPSHCPPCPKPVNGVDFGESEGGARGADVPSVRGPEPPSHDRLAAGPPAPISLIGSSRLRPPAASFEASHTVNAPFADPTLDGTTGGARGRPSHTER